MDPIQLTTAAHGHVLTNAQVWSPDSRWIVYDVRSAADGAVFDGTRIERVDVATGRVEVLYESRDGGCCGVASCSPVDDRVAFILGPERPGPGWTYGPARRQGAVVRGSRPGRPEFLDARDLMPPFTPGALRGGSHVHVFSPDGRLVSFTYEDAVLEAAAGPSAAAERNLRGVGVTVCDRPVCVPRTHPRNHDGSGFSVVVTRLVDEPSAGGDDIVRAFEEAWVGSDGYRRADGSWQRRAIAFQGLVRSASGRMIAEVFVADLPADDAGFACAGAGPLAGTSTTRPQPPRDVAQRRLTRSEHRRHPGIEGPRHWLRSNPAGDRIGFLTRDDDGVVQLHTVSPVGGEPEAVTGGPHGIASSFTWSPDGTRVACVCHGSVGTVDVETGGWLPLTDAVRGRTAPRPEACVFSPDGRWIAFTRELPGGSRGEHHNQVFVVAAEP